jgi:hypothetical protein
MRRLKSSAEVVLYDRRKGSARRTRSVGGIYAKSENQDKYMRIRTNVI